MRQMKENIKEICLSAIFVFVVGITVLLISCGMIAQNTAIYYPIEIWYHGCTIMDFFLPLLVSLPFSYVMLMKRKCRFIEYVAVRVKKTSYIHKQILAGMLLSAVAVFLMYFISLFVSVNFFYQGATGGSGYVKNYVFGTYQVESPMLFGFVWCLWKGIVASLFTWFGYMIALYIDNIFVVSLAPFIYCMAENMITGIIQIPEYSVLTSYVLNRLSPEVMHVWTFAIGVVVFVFITSIITFGVALRRRRLYENVQKY